MEESEIRELVAHLERTGGLRHLRGSVVEAAHAGLQLPSSLLHVIAERTSELAPPVQQLLTIASVLGTRFELDVLAAVAGRSPEAVIEVLDEAVKWEVLVDEGQGDYVWGDAKDIADVPANLSRSESSISS